MRIGSHVPAASVTVCGTRASTFGAGNETFWTGTFSDGGGAAAGAGGGGGVTSADRGAGSTGGVAGGGTFLAITKSGLCRTGGGMGDGFSRTGTREWTGGGTTRG